MPDEPFVITDNVPNDLLPEVARIYFNAFEAKIGGILKRDGTAERFLVAIMRPEYAVFALSADRREVLGVAGFKTVDGAFTEGGIWQMIRHYGIFGSVWRILLMSVLERPVSKGEMQMDGIAVDASARGRGVGTALIEKLVERARALNLTKISLDVIDTNPRAQRLYTRLGFEPVGTESTGPFKFVFGFEKSLKMTKSVEIGGKLGE